MPGEHTPDGGRFYGLYEGVVIANDHPEKAGWCRIRIPGLIDEGTGWARPCGAPGGGGTNTPGQRRGLHMPTPVGADVIVGFLQGDVDAPVFWTGTYGSNVEGKSEVPGIVGGYAKPNRDTAAPGTPETVTAAEATQITALETANYVVIIDDRPGKVRLVLQDKNTGDGITFDGVAKTLEIVGLSSIMIRTEGNLTLRGAQLILNDRAVLASTKGIGLWHVCQPSQRTSRISIRRTSAETTV